MGTRRAIDAVIVDWDTTELAEACYDSLQVAKGMFRSIEVVDAKERGWTYAQSVNRALSEGSAPVVLALNADVRMLAPPLPELAIFDAHADVAVVGPRQVDHEGRITHAGVFGSNTQPGHRAWKSPLTACDAETSEPIRDAVMVAGSIFFARRTAWAQLGGFLETPHYYDETWFCYLARHRGWRVVYTGANTWIHMHMQTPTPPDVLRARFLEAQRMFRDACAREGIECD